MSSWESSVGPLTLIFGMGLGCRSRSVGQSQMPKIIFASLLHCLMVGVKVKISGMCVHVDNRMDAVDLLLIHYWEKKCM